MSKVTLQVPISKEIKFAAQRNAEAMGFSSLQEAVRLFLNKLSAGLIDIGFENKVVKLSEKNDKRYAKIIEEIKKGKNVTKTRNINELFELLAS